MADDREPQPDKAQPAAAPEAPAAKAAPAAAKATLTTKAAPAAKPAKPAPPPDPRAEAASRAAAEVRTALEAALGEGVVEETGVSRDVPIVRIAAARWRDAVRFLRDSPDCAYDYVELFAGTDYKDYIEVVMYLCSTGRGAFLNVKTRTPRDDARLPSLVELFPGVDWEEREVYDLLGVFFEGHPDLRRIMMWDGWNGHPLRKDYSDFENVPPPPALADRPV